LVVRQQALVAELTSAHAALAEHAAAGERQRIAADLHDVVAHSFAVTLLHLTGARLMAKRHGDTELVDALGEAERAGRAGMQDLRAAVGLLDGADSARSITVPGTAGLMDLIRDYERAGLPIRTEVGGDATSIHPLVGVAMYRILQQALANVARHAAGSPTEIEIRFDSPVSLMIRNELAGSVRSPRRALGRGHGIAGMRERAKQVGGTLIVDRAPRSWTVRAALPVTPDRRP